jgi:hypothetical protein
VVTIRVPALKGHEFAAKVSRTAEVLDPKTRTLRVEIDSPNPDGKLRPGMYAVAALPMEGDQTKDTDHSRALAKTQLELVQKAYDAAVRLLEQTRRTGEIIIPLGKPDEVYLWSVRWLSAQRAMSDKKTDQIAALEEHLKRMKDLQLRVTVLHKGGLANQLEPIAAEFYRVEAELWLMREKTK